MITVTTGTTIKFEPGFDTGTTVEMRRELVYAYLNPEVHYLGGHNGPEARGSWVVQNNLATAKDGHSEGCATYTLTLTQKGIEWGERALKASLLSDLRYDIARTSNDINASSHRLGQNRVIRRWDSHPESLEALWVELAVPAGLSVPDYTGAPDARKKAPKSLYTLRKYDKVRIERNLEHPAWKNAITNGDIGLVEIAVATVEKGPTACNDSAVILAAGRAYDTKTGYQTHGGASIIKMID